MGLSTGNRIVVEDSFHSSVGASSAERWLNCSGVVNLTKKLIEAGTIRPGTNHKAAEGTAAHLVLSSCMEDGSDAESMRDTEIVVSNWTFVVDSEMINGVQECIDFVRNRVARARVDGFEVEVYVEKSFGSFMDPDAWGTADILIHIVGDRLIVIDFKYGAGLTVEPTSLQNRYYGYLALENVVDDPSKIKVIESWIAQPRIPHTDGTIRRHVTNGQELTEWWVDVVIPGIEATRDPHAHLVIGSWCRWCPNADHCPALKKEAFEIPVGIDGTHLDDNELGELINKIDALEGMKPGLEAEALRRARDGAKIPHRKLVRKQSKRQFRTEMALPHPTNPDERIVVKYDDEVLKVFGAEAYQDPKLRTPPMLEDNVEGGKAFVSKWAYTPDEGTTLAKTADRRSEVLPNIQQLRGRVRGTI